MSNDPIWYQNQAECEEALKLPSGTLRKAKRLGSPGFAANGRVQWNLVQEWIANNQEAMLGGGELGEEDLKTLRAEGLKLDNALKKIELAKAEGKYCERAYVNKLIHTLGQAITNIITQRLGNEFIVVCANKGVDDLTVETNKVIQEILTELRAVKV